MTWKANRSFKGSHKGSFQFDRFSCNRRQMPKPWLQQGRVKVGVKCDCVTENCYLSKGLLQAIIKSMSL